MPEEAEHNPFSLEAWAGNTEENLKRLIIRRQEFIGQGPNPLKGMGLQ